MKFFHISAHFSQYFAQLGTRSITDALMASPTGFDESHAHEHLWLNMRVGGELWHTVAAESSWAVRI